MTRRVYEIAREHGLASRELLERLQAAGANVTTHSSGVDEELALRVLAVATAKKTRSAESTASPTARANKPLAAKQAARKTPAAKKAATRIPVAKKSTAPEKATAPGKTAAARKTGPRRTTPVLQTTPVAAPREPPVIQPVPSRRPRPNPFANSVWLSFAATLLVVVALSGAIGWALSEAFSNTSTSSAAVSLPSKPAGSHRAVSHGWSSVAVARYGELTVYRGPSTQNRMLTLSKPTPTQSVTLLVKQQRASWVQTYLPMRPNGALGWVRRSSIRVFRDPWAVVIHLHSHRLVLRRANRLIKALPIAVGKASTPTPTGHFFVNELLKQPDPAGPYGPYAFGTSDFSDVITHFGAGGNGQIGIHGTDQPWVIGTSASHGCIRLYNTDITWLAQRIPLGTPVQIVG